MATKEIESIDAIPSETYNVEQKFSIWYNSPEAVWMRMLVSSVPSMGGVLNQLLSCQGQLLAKARFERLIKELSKQMMQIDSEKIDQQYLQSENFFDLICCAIEKSLRIRNSDRASAVVRVIIGAVTHEIDEIALPEDIIAIIAELSDDAAVVLKSIYTANSQGVEVKNYGATIMSYVPDELHSRLHFLLKRIESIGLISEKTGARFSYSGGDYYLTDTGTDIINYIMSPRAK